MKFEYVLFAIIAAAILLAAYFPSMYMIIPKGPSTAHEGQINEAHAALLQKYIDSGKYRCCLKEACHYCMFKKRSEKDEAICDCLDDVVEGRFPCGECAGEILEGKGNYYLRSYFAKSLASEMGEDSYPMLKRLMQEKYGISPEEQA